MTGVQTCALPIFTLNGGTTGGLIGGLITIVDVAANKYAVVGTSVGSGTEATPFSAAV